MTVVSLQDQIEIPIVKSALLNRISLWSNSEYLEYPKCEFIKESA